MILLPISDKYQEYSEKVLNILKKHDIRALIDDRSEKTGKKIRDAEPKLNNLGSGKKLILSEIRPYIVTL